MDSSLKNLPVHERIRIVEDLWDSIASDQNSLSLSSAQKVELDKRLEAYEVTKDPGRPAEEVISEIRSSAKEAETEPADAASWCSFWSIILTLF